MTIEILDWIIYVALILIIWYKILPDDLTEELGAIGGMFIIIIFTIIYAITFYFLSWHDDIFPLFLNLNNWIKFKW
jgi:hypothetical protein